MKELKINNSSEIAVQKKLSKLKETISAIKSLETNSKMEFIKYTNSLYNAAGEPDFAEFKYNRTTIATLSKSINKSILISDIYLVIKSFTESLNVKRNMTEDQQVEAAATLFRKTVSDGYLETLEDVIVFFQGCKEGRYGTIMDRIDLQTIMAMRENFLNFRHDINNALVYEDVPGYDRQENIVSVRDIYDEYKRKTVLKNEDKDRQLSEKVNRLGATLKNLKDKLYGNDKNDKKN